jgi:leucyl aminopeptidase
MNFEIQKRALSRVIRDELDALLVLWPAPDKAQAPTETAAQDPLTLLLKAALAHGDFEHKPGAVLSLYAHPGIQARHVVIVSVVERPCLPPGMH